VSTNLDHFNLIVPCGIAGRGVTSFERLLGRPVAMTDVEGAVVDEFLAVFGRHPAPWAPAVASKS
jgi:lipoyl(octanoyl) transferase